MSTVRYLGTDENILFPRTLKNMYQLIANNIEQAWKIMDTKAPIPDRKLGEGDSVLLQDHTTGVWDPRYMGD